ncbi:MAG: trimethylamine methyltransferase [Spirochaetes bacterium]|nr:trimethylamine methyltransferase [Spirochaetota bacterium]
MISGGVKGGKYKPLGDEQVLKIHNASIRILEKTGFLVEEKEALELFKDAGAKVADSRVWLSAAFIEDMIDSAPKAILLAGREKKNDIFLENGHVYIGSGGAALKVIDIESGKLRKAGLKDVAMLAKLVDGLDNIHFYLVPVYPDGLDKNDVDVNTYYNAIKNTTKHVQSGIYSVKGIRDVILMAGYIAGGEAALRRRPIVSFITSWMISPLKFDPTVTRLLIEAARAGMPVVLSSAPMAGVTAPVTLAGMLVQVNAEQLAGICLTQIVSRGTPVIPGPIPAIADMRSGSYLTGTPEFGLANAAIAQIMHYYNLPIYNSAGLTDSKVPDIQAGFEKGISLVIDALAGANYIHHAAGLVENMSTIIPEQFVIDNEMIGMTLRILRGIEVNDDTIAIDVINKVGPGGNYLAEEHTLKYMRSEFFYPSKVIDRELREKWEKNSNTDIRCRARQITMEILENHKPEPLGKKIDQQIRKEFNPIVV